MHASYPHNSTPDEADGVTIEDWDFLFEAVSTRLRDNLVGDANSQQLFPLVLECFDTLEQLRHLHPLARHYVR